MSARFRPHPDAVAMFLGDDLVLVQLRTDRIHQLNRTAARVWELVCAGCDRAEIQRRMLDEFNVSEDRLSVEIDDCLRTLQAEKLVRHDRGPVA